MQESEVLSTLISDIYDAALDPSLWVPVLGRLTEFADGYSATLCIKSANKGHLFYGEGKIEPRYMDLYFEKYAKLDPTTDRFFVDVGTPVAAMDFLAYDELLKTRFYEEWIRPQKLVDFATMVVDRSDRAATFLCLLRHERDGFVDDEVRRKLRLVMPHLRRSVLIGRTIDHMTVSVAGLADALDGLSAGMFLVDDMRAIVHANASGRAMISAGKVLRAANGRLVASDPKLDRELRAVLTAASVGDGTLGIAGIAQPLAAQDGERYVAHVMPLTSGARRRAGRHHAATAALFVHKAALQMNAVPEAIARTYQLTPSEGRVLLAIVQVGGVPETADALGVSESTVKTHLQRVFSKTGVSRQADLVKLVAEFSNPLVN
jgi:DNA-binding CsgD family transcriptional regulator